jgi:hypothetical protein
VVEERHGFLMFRYRIPSKSSLQRRHVVVTMFGLGVPLCVSEDEYKLKLAVPN